MRSRPARPKNFAPKHEIKRMNHVNTVETKSLHISLLIICNFGRRFLLISEPTMSLLRPSFSPRSDFLSSHPFGAAKAL